jgi:hypothetical protein
MTKEETADSPMKSRWAISSDWFTRNNRSITALLENYLCPECARKFTAGEKESSSESLMDTVNSCCSHLPGFINEKTPLLEGMFRFFLSNGNTPVTIEELSEHLNRIRGGNAYLNSPETLLRLLKADMYYGLQETES